MGENVQTTSPLKLQNKCTPKKWTYTPRGVSSKVIQRIVKFQILNFAFFVNMGLDGSKSFK